METKIRLHFLGILHQLHLVQNENMKKIPALSTGATEGTKSFKVKIDGNIESASAVKSFMWLMNEAEAQAKKQELIQNSQILNKMPTLKEKLMNQTTGGTTNTTTPSTGATQSSAQTTTNETKPKEGFKTEFKNELKDQLRNKINNSGSSLPNFLNDIGTKKE